MEPPGGDPAAETPGDGKDSILKERLFGLTSSEGDHGKDVEEVRSISCRLTDLFTGAVYERESEEMFNPGLYIDLEAWGFHFLKFYGSAEKVF